MKLSKDEVTIVRAVNDQRSAEILRLRQLVESLDSLLACYRLQKRPSERLLERIAKLREVSP